jgi:hypothetical protein
MRSLSVKDHLAIYCIATFDASLFMHALPAFLSTGVSCTPSFIGCLISQALRLHDSLTVVDNFTPITSRVGTMEMRASRMFLCMR